MVKSTLILLPIMFLANAVLAKSVSSSDDLIYVGNFDENDYYISANAAGWSSAETDCRNHFGNNGHLIAIETLAEWEFLLVTLERYGTGTTFWTSGMYDPITQLWRWTKNNQALAAFSPWGVGHPSTTPNQLLRVLLYYTSRFDAHWRTVPNTQLHRYICEVYLTV